jgi:hypothetical protein
LELWAFREGQERTGQEKGTYVLNVPEWEKDKWMHFAFVWELDRDAKTIILN